MPSCSAARCAISITTIRSVLDTFGEFIRPNQVPVLAICGGHQLVGLSFGARVMTLDRLEQHEQRQNRPLEYQYRFIRITEPRDPIFRDIKILRPTLARMPRIRARFAGVAKPRSAAGSRARRLLVAGDFLSLPQSDDGQTQRGQLIYTVQFHLEKSFEDWNKSRTRWEHQNESRDGRILFENFLQLALAHSP